MKKRILILGAVFALATGMLGGCGNNAQTQPTPESSKEAVDNSDSSAQEESGKETADEAQQSSTDVQTTALEDGIYDARFDTDSSMFHINEANDGRGTLTVENGKMTIHISLPSKNIVNLYVGTAEDAQKEGAELLQPTTDTVTYSDGTTEEVYGFDVPVEALDQEFDLALIGTKGTWYDHKVSVSDPQKVE